MATKTTTLKPFNNGAADEDDGVDDNDCDNNEAHRGEHLQMNLHNEKNEKESIINVQVYLFVAMPFLYHNLLTYVRAFLLFF